MGALLNLISVLSLFPGAILPGVGPTIESTVLSSEITHRISPPPMEVVFVQSPGVHIGDPVLFQGSVIGSVSKVSSKKSDNDSSEFTAVELQFESVSLMDLFLGRGLPQENLVGLASNLNATAIVSSNEVHKPTASRAFVELVKVASTNKTKSDAVVPELSMTLQGFSSFQEFWSSGQAINPIL